MKTVTTIEISTKTILKVVVIILALILAWKIRAILLSLLTAFILMSGFAILADWFHSKGINRTAAAILSYALSIVILAGILFLVLPPLIVQIRDFITNLPSYVQQISAFYDGNQLPYVRSQNLADLLTTRIESSLDGVLRFLLSTVNGFLNFITIAILSFYLLIERDRIKNNLFRLFPHLQKDRVTNLAHNVERVVGAWVRGELILMFVVGLMTYVGLSLLKVEYALPLAIIAGLLEAVPVIGPIISSIPAILVALVGPSPFTAIGVALLFTVIQQLENNLLVPKVMEAAAGINPLVTILALLIGASLFGLPGAIIAIPTAAIVQVVAADFLKNNHKN